MERTCVYFAIFVLIFHCILAQDQTGFISLDCGLSPSESPYNEFSTGLTYISDSGFIQSGRTGRIAREFEPGYNKPLLTLRYFPDGVRNCYSLNVTRDTNYMIRVSFVYGNYDGRNVIPNFDLYFGPNMWANVSADNTTREIIHKTNSSSLQVCLVRTGTTIPIINTLDLRPLRNDNYVTQSGSLNLLFRAYLSNSTRTIRYPDDVYDRRWSPYFKEKEWMPVTTTSKIVSSDVYDLPQSVMATAAIPLDVNSALNITWFLEPPNTQYLYRHVAELQTLPTNETREFNMVLNGQITFRSYNPKPLEKETIFTRRPNKCSKGMCILELEKTQNSTLPPLLNAIEVFSVLDLSQMETNEDDVASIKNIQDIYELSRISWQGDPCVPKQFAWDGLNCDNSDNSTPPIIISLNMSSSDLTGNITQAFQNLKHLQELDLSNNSLVGEVPDFLATMKSLVVINLSGNNLSGSVPETLLQKKGFELNIEGNPHLLCGSISCMSKPGDDKQRRKSIIAPIIASIVTIAVLMGALVLFFVLKKKKSSNVDGTRSDLGIFRSSELAMITKNRQFTYSEVVTMTNNFQRALGKGGSGMVYHGFVNGTEEVAVKLLSHSTAQDYKQFKAEVELLLKVYHKNLVSFVGYCNEGESLALIYEYMANGDLKKHMLGTRTRSTLNWRTRLKILVESAQGLEYLHNGCKPLMVHRDVKTANILLNEHFEAKLADFGISRSFLIDGDSHVSTVVAGTPGYLDPEYCKTNRLTEKSDVYSFGIVLLEIITNQPVIDQRREREHIAEWVRLMLSKGDIMSIMDPNLNGDYDSSSVWKVVELSMYCLNPISARRPTMSEVVIELNESLASEISRRGASGYKSFKSSIEVTTAFSNEPIPKAR